MLRAGRQRINLSRRQQQREKERQRERESKREREHGVNSSNNSRATTATPTDNWIYWAEVYQSVNTKPLAKLTVAICHSQNWPSLSWPSARRPVRPLRSMRIRQTRELLLLMLLHVETLFGMLVACGMLLACWLWLYVITASQDNHHPSHSLSLSSTLCTVLKNQVEYD